MIDLSEISPEQRAGIRNDLIENFQGYSSNIDFMQRIAWSKRINSNVHISSPGVEGVGLASHRPTGDPVNLRSTKVRAKTILTQDLDNAYSLTRDQVRQMDNLLDAKNQITKGIVYGWADTMHAAVVEYMTNNLGAFDVLGPNTDVTGHDGIATFAANKYGGALNNTLAQTGLTPPAIKQDFWDLYNQMKKAIIPGTRRFFWGGASLKDLDILIMFPTSLNQAMHDVFATDYFLAMSGGVAYNASASNILADKNFCAPTLIDSGYLDDISTTAYYVFFTPKSVPGSQAFQFAFNPNYKYTQDPNKNGLTMTFGSFDKTARENYDGDFFKLQYLGEGSERDVLRDEAAIVSKTSFAMVCAQPYRCGRIQ